MSAAEELRTHLNKLKVDELAAFVRPLDVPGIPSARGPVRGKWKEKTVKLLVSAEQKAPALFREACELAAIDPEAVRPDPAKSEPGVEDANVTRSESETSEALPARNIWITVGPILAVLAIAGLFLLPDGGTKKQPQTTADDNAATDTTGSSETAPLVDAQEQRAERAAGDPKASDDPAPTDADARPSGQPDKAAIADAAAEPTDPQGTDDPAGEHPIDAHLTITGYFAYVNGLQENPELLKDYERTIQGTRVTWVGYVRQTQHQAEFPEIQLAPASDSLAWDIAYVWFDTEFEDLVFSRTYLEKVQIEAVYEGGGTMPHLKGLSMESLPD